MNAATQTASTQLDKTFTVLWNRIILTSPPLSMKFSMNGIMNILPWTLEWLAHTQMLILSKFLYNYSDTTIFYQLILPRSRNFAQLAVDKVTRIGCATVQYTEGSKFRVFTVCNYASSPQDGQPLYVTGCPLAQCLKGKNNDFPGLCHPSEIIDPNFFDWLSKSKVDADRNLETFVLMLLFKK